ncbi:MAG: molecular chaperone HtpG [Planctomycetota bacterium]|jgi:molecular chaperone HtpG
MSSTTESHSFQAEVNQVLSIVVNSLYSHPEIFLRELISNASDALDKLSFKSLTDHELLGDDKELRIEIIPNPDGRTLLIRDNGIGMSHDELIENLGTIARSGSKKLMEALSGDEKKDLSLIGQFGVGFYSSFLVADKVTVTSRAAGEDKAWQWQSEAKNEFQIEESEKGSRGTNIILHLKEGCDEHLSEWSLKSLIRKYSDYVRYPIRLQVERSKEIEGEKDEDGKPKTEQVKEWETVNQANALWTRPKSEITQEQYDEFYKHLSHDWQEPLTHSHFKIEGTQELSGLLFVPKTAPMDLFERKNHGLRLFIKRVFIMDDCEELLPDWLRFMRGIVDSEDLPLNVSRELLQQDRVTKAIRKQITVKSLALIEDLAKEGETEVEGEEGEEKTTRNRYLEFWSQFGRVLKEGIHTDAGYKDQIAGLLRYESSREEGLTSLAEYVDRMGEDQPGIYYITAESIDAARNSPQLEGLKKAGYEVLFMADPVDEWILPSLMEFEEKKLIPAAKGNLDLPESEEEKKEQEEKASEFSGLLEKVKGNLEENVKEVRLTRRLTDSPACLVSDEQALSPHLERILRANGQPVPEQKRILELNPEHPVVERLQSMAESGDSAELERWSRLVLDQALLAEGTMPADPAAFAKAISELMQKS